MLLLRHRGLLVRIHQEARRIKTLRLERLRDPLLRVNAKGRVHHQLAHLHDLLLLLVTLHQGRAATRINGEVPLDRVVLAKQHQPLVVPANVRLGHPVIEQAGNAAQHRSRVVLQHHHTAHGIRGIRALTLHQRR